MMGMYGKRVLHAVANFAMVWGVFEVARSFWKSGAVSSEIGAYGLVAIVVGLGVKTWAKWKFPLREEEARGRFRSQG